jgi:hypothetical protein
MHPAQSTGSPGRGPGAAASGNDTDKGCPTPKSDPNSTPNDRRGRADRALDAHRHRSPPTSAVVRTGTPRPIRARAGHLRARLGKSERYRETDSGAVSAGSNPAGGTTQRHEFEHSNNLEPVRGQACDLRQCSALRGLAPDTRPESTHRPGKGPAQLHLVITVARPLPCPQTVALLNIRSYTAATSTLPGRGCPARPIALMPLGRRHTPSLVFQTVRATEPLWAGRAAASGRPGNVRI